jgi:hypothetical protein
MSVIVYRPLTNSVKLVTPRSVNYSSDGHTIKTNTTETQTQALGTQEEIRVKDGVTQDRKKWLSIGTSRAERLKLIVT